MVFLHLDHRALAIYTDDTLMTPKLWRRMEGPLKELDMEIQYCPGKEMMADGFTPLRDNQSDGRYRGILLGQDKFAQDAWMDIQ